MFKIFVRNLKNEIKVSEKQTLEILVTITKTMITVMIIILYFKLTVKKEVLLFTEKFEIGRP